MDNRLTDDLFEIRGKPKNLIVEVENIGIKLKSHENLRTTYDFSPIHYIEPKIIRSQHQS